jgi:hypothetical protein
VIGRQRVAYRSRAGRALGLTFMLGGLLSPAGALAQVEVWPGRATVQVRYPASPQPEEDDDVIARASVQQNVKLASLAPGVTLLGQGQVTYVRDTKKLNYNNKLVAGVGLAVETAPAPFLTFQAGVRHDWEHRYVTDRDSAAFVGFAGWSLSKELGSSGGSERPDLIVSSWGEARYPSAPDPQERHDTILEGAAEVAKPVAGSAQDPMLQLTTSVDFKADTKKLDWNNQLSPAAGIKLALPLAGVAAAELGMRYEANYRFYSERFRHGPAAWVAARARW